MKMQFLIFSKYELNKNRFDNEKFCLNMEMQVVMHKGGPKGFYDPIISAVDVLFCFFTKEIQAQQLWW